MENTLLNSIEYKIVKTRFGIWKSFGYQNGNSYHEFISDSKIFGLPVFHYTYGINPETGRRKWAEGFIALGRFARGVIAIGHIGIGVIAFGQLSLGFLVFA
ncbi:MAG: hypothetical protein K6357_05930 [Elusimicrobiota bacterium]